MVRYFQHNQYSTLIKNHSYHYPILLDFDKCMFDRLGHSRLWMFVLWIIDANNWLFITSTMVWLVSLCLFSLLSWDVLKLLLCNGTKRHLKIFILNSLKLLMKLRGYKAWLIDDIGYNDNLSLGGKCSICGTIFRNNVRNKWCKEYKFFFYNKVKLRYASNKITR